MKIIFCLFEVLVQVKTSLTAQEVPTGEEEEEAKWNDRYFVQSWLKNASSCPLICPQRALSWKHSSETQI